jgi:transposase InsO family protein
MDEVALAPRNTRFRMVWSHLPGRDLHPLGLVAEFQSVVMTSFLSARAYLAHCGSHPEHGSAILRRGARGEVLLRDWGSIDELRAATEAWVVRCNRERPHQALAWKTSAEYRAERLAGQEVAAA